MGLWLRLFMRMILRQVLKVRGDAACVIRSAPDERGEVLSEQKARTSEKMASLLEIRSDAYRLQSLLANGPIDLAAFGRVLDETWKIKRGLASTITTSQIDCWFNRALEAGALDDRPCGAVRSVRFSAARRL